MNVGTNKLRSGNESSVVVGSGYLYACPANAIKNPYNITETERAAMEEIGYIESNAVLSAKATSTPVKSANYGKIFNIYSEKEVSFTTGIISWNMEHVSKYLTGSKYEKTANGTRYYYGVHDRAPSVTLLFVAEDDYEGKRISIVMPLAQFQGELEMDFNAENPVSFNYAFDLMGTVNPVDQKSNYFYMIEEETNRDVGGSGAEEPGGTEPL